MILVITNKQDAHPTPVIEYLNEKQYPVFRLNTEALLTDYRFSWWADNTGTDFYLKNIRNGMELYGHDITAVWERRPMHPAEMVIRHEEEAVNQHNLKEASGFLSFLLHYVSCYPCIGHHLYDRSAASKMSQLRLAQELGMTIPPTCFSNEKRAIVSFARPYEYVALKPIENDNVWLGNEKEYVFFVRKVQSSLLAELPEEVFTQTVSYVQAYIDKQFEVRVTVVGNKVFACKIDSQRMDEATGKIDWRQGYEHGLRHEVCELPDDITAFCHTFLQHMHLNFGCFDFIVTPKGAYVFLECNPNGQWLWIEQETELPISEAIAEWLSTRTDGN